MGHFGRDETECLMEHQQGLNKIYANFDNVEERLEEIYKQAIPELSIFQRAVQVVQVNEEMKKN